MFRIRTIILLSILFISLTGCDREKTENITLTIASIRAPYVESMINSPRYFVKYEGDQQWSLFYNVITGFDYQEGNEYVLNVKVTTISNPPMDAGSKDYNLNYIISCKEKESENVPTDWFSYRNDD